MKSSPDPSKQTQENIKVLPDGTKVKQYKETEHLSDGSFIVRARTSKTYPEDVNGHVTKTVKTSITRYNPDGVVCTATTATWAISVSTDGKVEPSDETETCTREDGSVAITTRTTHVLPDGYISTVVAEAVISAESVNTEDGGVACIRALPVLASAASFGYKNDASHDDNEQCNSNLKAVDGNTIELPRLEQIDAGSAVVPPSFAKAPGVEMVDGPYVSGKELARQRKVESEKKQRHSSSRQQQQPELTHDSSSAKAPARVNFAKAPGVDMIPGEPSTTAKQYNEFKSESRNRSDQENKSINLEHIPNSDAPLPMAFITNQGSTLVDEAHDLLSRSIDSEEFNGSSNGSLNGTFRSKSNKRGITLQTIESEMEVPMPTTFTEEQIKIDIEDDQTEKYNEAFLSGSNYSKHTVQSYHTNGDCVPGPTANLAVATPVDNDELTIVEAEKYVPQSIISKYKTWKCMGLTLALLFIISTIVAVSVHYGTKQIKKDTVQVVYVTPSPTHASTLPPTTARDAAITQTIESNALQRNAKFNTMSADDPRILALDWILYDDEMQLEANDPGLIQRYTLALLLFQFELLVRHYDSFMDATLDSLSSTHECEWFDITCNEGRVTELDLCKYQASDVHLVNHFHGNSHSLCHCFVSTAYYDLVGSIAPELGNLDSLESLILNDNCIYGTIPPELSELTNLQYLDLAFNGLSGTVFELSSSLEHLDLSWQSNNYINCTASDGRVYEPLYQMGDPDDDYNYGLEGKFLEQVGRLENLQYINLDQNSFDGTISPGIGNLKQLGKSCMTYSSLFI
jgi:hypothetical protein